MSILVKYRDRNKGNYDVAFSSLFLLSLYVGFVPLVSELKKERKVCYMKSFRVVPKRKKEKDTVFENPRKSRISTLRAKRATFSFTFIWAKID